VSAVLRRLVEPNCVDANDRSKVLGKSDRGACGAGVPEYRAIDDLHVGVISTSLGSPTDAQGNSVCDVKSNPRLDDQAHLRNQARDGSIVPSATNGFLTFGPGSSVLALEEDAAKIIVGVDQNGCGLEAQLESMYRFLAQPDPPQKLVIDGVTPRFDGVDETLLAQRKAFLRPDSALSIVMITDEDDSTVDPMALGKRGWAYGALTFPGSTTGRGHAKQGTTAPRATNACATTPLSPDCKPCIDAPTDPGCTDVFWGAAEDSLNVRFFDMKRRFGVDPQYPIERYVRALTNRRVPNRTTDHDPEGTYVHAETCTNPIFAKTLPATAGEELCKREEGTRSRRLIHFALIGGVPSQLVDPRSPSQDWTKILGASPETWDTTGIDPHMKPSIAPRAGLPAASATRGDNGTDPMHGREWDTKNEDLQYACTFALPAARSCAASYDPACECGPDLARNPPLCNTTPNTEQTRGKAYPTVRELRVAKALGERAIVSSICAPDPKLGYAPAFDALVQRMSRVLVP